MQSRLQRHWFPFLALGVFMLSAFALPVKDLPRQVILPEHAGPGSVYVVPVEGMIDRGLARYLSRAISEAEKEEAAVVILHMDTYGGLVNAADDIRKTLLNTSVATITFVDKNAASAGALISYATDRIVMVPGASIGAATVVVGTGEAAPDKYQSYMRAQMRATAEAKGRDPNIAQAMVDESIEIEGVTIAGQVLTLSSSEALEVGVADAILPTLEALIADLDLADRDVVNHRATTAERVLRVLGSPAIASVLMLMMMGGLYFELQSPGVGFPGAISVIATALFFAPHYMLGMVEGWEVVLFFVGVILVVVEIFMLPGFGVAGISGAVLIIVSLVASRIGDLGVIWPSSQELTSAVLTFATALGLLIVLIFSMGRYLPSSPRFNRLVLAPELTSATGYTSAETHEELLGKTGIALTPLRPSGVAEFDGERVDVVSRGDFIPSGASVRVTNVRGMRVEVRMADAPTPGAHGKATTAGNEGN